MPMIEEEDDIEDATAYDEEGNEIIMPKPTVIKDGCLPVSLFVYDDCSIARLMVNERFRLHPSDSNISGLQAHLPPEHIILK